MGLPGYSPRSDVSGEGCGCDSEQVGEAASHGASRNPSPGVREEGHPAEGEVEFTVEPNCEEGGRLATI